jgi:hypothetical protein
MQGFDEFCDDDDNDAGDAPHPPADDVPPVIGVDAGASVASAGAALLGLQFRQTRCTFKELMEGKSHCTQTRLLGKRFKDLHCHPQVCHNTFA